MKKQFSLFLNLIVICFSSYSYAQFSQNQTDSISDNKMPYQKNIVTKSWKEAIQIVKDDKALVEINTMGLYLMDYQELENDAYYINKILDNPLNDSTYLPVYENKNIESINYFEIKQLLKDKNRPEDLEKEKNYEQYVRAIIGFEDFDTLQVIRLKWRYYDKVFFTNAIFTQEKLVYDEIMNNLSHTTFKHTTTETIEKKTN